MSHSRYNMQTDVDTLIEIPCFKCLFWDRKRESSLYCNPNECQELTEWLLRQSEDYPQSEETLAFERASILE